MENNYDRSLAVIFSKTLDAGLKDFCFDDIEMLLAMGEAIGKGKEVSVFLWSIYYRMMLGSDWFLSTYYDEDHELKRREVVSGFAGSHMLLIDYPFIYKYFTGERARDLIGKMAPIDNK